MVEGWSGVRGARLGWTSIGDGPLVGFDARGHGVSTGGEDPLRPDHYTWAELARDLLELVRDIDVGAGTAPIDAIGASMGTGTLLHAALQAPPGAAGVCQDWESIAAHCVRGVVAVNITWSGA